NAGRCIQYVVHAAHCVSRFIEQGLLFFIQFKVNNFLPSITSDNYRNTEANIFLSIFTVQVNAGRNKFFLIANNSFYHGSSGGSGCIPCRSAQQLSERSTTNHCVGYNLLLLFFAQEMSYRNAVPGCI